MKREPKNLKCKSCGNEVRNCGSDAVAVTCHKCVTISLRGFVAPNSTGTKTEDQ